MDRLITLSTAGSVDDGKSTLLGRLILDSRNLHATSADAISADAELDLSEFTDGLAAEREQKITIDVGWRHLSLNGDRYLLADSPGHEQYTRNQVTAASHADALIVLIDPTKLDLDAPTVRLLPQTYRHFMIATLLGIRDICLVINKLDLLADPEKAFVQVTKAINRMLDLQPVNSAGVVTTTIPASALKGDNIVRRAEFAEYTGPTVLEWLQETKIRVLDIPKQDVTSVMSVQTTLRSAGQSSQPFRGVAGRISRGRFSVGQAICVLPEKLTANIVSIRRLGDNVSEGFAGQSVTLELDRELDVTRGAYIVSMSLTEPERARALNACGCHLFWLDGTAGQTGKSYLLKTGTREIQARITELNEKFDPDDFSFVRLSDQLAKFQPECNGIYRARFRFSAPIWLELSSPSESVLNRFLLIEPQTFKTVAAGIFDVRLDPD